MQRGYWYLGSPYSQYGAGMLAAHIAVCREAARLIDAGLPVFCPIAHSHPIAYHGGIDALNHEIWLPADQPLMDAAVGLVVLQLDGWKESKGLKYEIEVFEKAGKPVHYLKPGGKLTTIVAQFAEAA